MEKLDAFLVYSKESAGILSRYAQPWALVRGKPGAELTLEVIFHRGRKHLPIVKLKRAA